MNKKNLILNGLGLSFILRKLWKTTRLSYSSYREAERVNSYNRILVNWINNDITSAYLQSYFQKRKWNRIAIYGTATLGELFYYRIKNTDIEIAYLMDKSVSKDLPSFEGIPLYHPNYEGQLPEVDVIIVTACFYLNDIVKELTDKKIPTKKILSLEKIVS